MDQARTSMGFSLIEILLVIGIIAVLAIAAFVIYPQVQSRSKAETETGNLLAVLASVQTLAGPAGNYRGMTNAVINQAGFVPGAWNGGDRTTNLLTNGFGGVITVRPSNGGASACGAASHCPGFRVDMGSIPTQACLHMMPILLERFDWVYARETSGGGSWFVVKSPLVGGADSTLKSVEGCNTGDEVTLLLAT